MAGFKSIKPADVLVSKDFLLYPFLGTITGQFFYLPTSTLRQFTETTAIVAITAYNAPGIAAKVIHFYLLQKRLFIATI